MKKLNLGPIHLMGEEGSDDEEEVEEMIQIQIAD